MSYIFCGLLVVSLRVRQCGRRPGSSVAVGSMGLVVSSTRCGIAVLSGRWITGVSSEGGCMWMSPSRTIME